MSGSTTVDAGSVGALSGGYQSGDHILAVRPGTPNTFGWTPIPSTTLTSSQVTTALGYTPVNPANLAAVATSGSYADLANKPTILTIGTLAGTAADGGALASLTTTVGNKTSTSGTVTAGHLAVYADSSGKVLTDGGAVPSGGSGGSGGTTLPNSAPFVSTNSVGVGEAGVVGSGLHYDATTATLSALLTIGTTTGTAADGGTVATLTSNLGAKATGPSSAVTGHLATFADTTGKVLQDGGAPLAIGTATGTAADGGTVATLATTVAAKVSHTGTVVAGHLAVFSDTTGLVLQDGGAVPGGGGGSAPTASQIDTALGYTPVNPSSLATVATSGSYADLTNKPAASAVKGYAGQITCDGTNSTYTLTHSLNSLNLQVTVRDPANGNVEIKTIESALPTVNTVSIPLGSVPISGTLYNVLCLVVA